MRFLGKRYWVVSILLLWSSFGAAIWPSFHGRAAADVRVENPQVAYTFGERITFRATIHSSVPIQEVALFFQISGQTDTQVVPVTVSPQGELRADYDAGQHPLRAFSHISYWYRVTLQSEGIYTSPHNQFYYEDNRFTWQRLEGKPIILHWHTGDVTFAQEVINVALAGVAHIQNYLPLTLPEQVQIYVYDSAREMQVAALLSNRSWVAGHADPSRGVILVSLPAGPEQHLEMERQIPHELMHVMLYQATGANYARLPAWFNEGLASVAELYPNPDYRILLENAYRYDSLLSLTGLCQTFPRDAAGALLAYAQAASFTRYLYAQFGTPGLDNLLTKYTSGMDCERGTEQALGKSLTGLEIQWRREVFGENAGLAILENFLPWLMISGAVLIAPLVLMIRGLRKRQAGIESPVER